MGSWFSSSLADFDDLETRLEAILSGSKNALLRSLSFDDKNTLSKSHGSAKFVYRRSRSLKSKEPEKMLSSITLFRRDQSSLTKDQDFGSLKIMQSSKTERNQAALKLQKVYKSFRTRRRLADCAVMVEQRWWKLLDFAELKRSSISFFDIEKPETAVSRWSRARTKAAKVGKGLSKDEKARKLALQHWLEAIDPRHRYGHNLQFYYAKWLHCQSRQPFFYWLDIGEGKEVNLEICPRSKLQQQCIKYLGPTERKTYEVALQDGKFTYKQSGEIVDTTKGPRDAKWIFVLSTSKTLYVGLKNKGTFQHSSFLAGGATLSAGRLVVEDGILKAVWPHSGHYLPTEENFQEFMTFLMENNVDLTNVKKNPGDEEDGESYEKSSDNNNASTKTFNISKQNTFPRNRDGEPKANHAPITLPSNMTNLEIPKQNYDNDDKSDDNGYETADETSLTEEDFMVQKQNLFEDEDKDIDEKPVMMMNVAKDKIMKRIDSHKGTKSYQLARQLTTRWSTGAGPRIGCMRDYPSELQFRVLEQANLSPRSNLSRPNQRVLLESKSFRIRGN